MGTAKSVFRIPRPSSHEEELHLFINQIHQCPNVRRGLATGAVVFPVGHYLWGLPEDQPTEVHSTDRCDGCGKYLRLYFAWKPGAHVFDLGAK